MWFGFTRSIIIASIIAVIALLAMPQATATAAATTITINVNIIAVAALITFAHEEVNAGNHGGGKHSCMLVYADGIVLVLSNVNTEQEQLNVLSN